jgi:prephenate dehydrogenase
VLESPRRAFYNAGGMNKTPETSGDQTLGRLTTAHEVETLDLESLNRESLKIDTLGIAGVGLIGGSISAAAKARGVCRRIVGFGRSRERLEAAARAGLIDDVATSYAAADTVDLFVSCLPVDRIADSIQEATRHMRPGTLATDAGSTKGLICEALGSEPAPGVTFVGSHPIAGSEKQGFEHADGDLFVGRMCVVTPTGAKETTVARIMAFWRQLGCRVVSMAPGEHDQILARTSHVPHVVAAAVAAGLRAGDEDFAGGGFRDVTRIAGGDPELWAAILYANRHCVAEEIERHIERCRELANALNDPRRSNLRTLLADAKARRESFLKTFNK